MRTAADAAIAGQLQHCRFLHSPPYAFHLQPQLDVFGYHPPTQKDGESEEKEKEDGEVEDGAGGL